MNPSQINIIKRCINMLIQPRYTSSYPSISKTPNLPNLIARRILSYPANDQISEKTLVPRSA